MSTWRKEAKAASEAKLNRMGLNKKTEKTPTFDGVHAWDGLEGLDSGVAGKMPVKKSRFKRGGKVKHMAAEGGAANKHLGKAPRKKAEGGRLPGQSEAAQYAQARRKAYDAYKRTSEASSAADKISEGDYDPAVKQYARENAKNMAAKAVGPDEGFGRAMKETGYGYQKGGRAHKMGGGAAKRYREAAVNDIRSQKNWKDRQRLDNLKGQMYGESHPRHNTKDILETEKRISRRERGLRMADDKFSGRANVPFKKDDDEYARGGFAGANPAARKAMAAKIAYKKKGGFGYGMSGSMNMVPGKKSGGKVHEDEAMDRKLVKSMVKPASLKGRMKKGGGGETPYNGPTHTFDLEMFGKDGKKTTQTLGGTESNMEDALNKWLTLAKKAGWEGANVKNMRTSYPGSSAGLMNKGGRAHKADGGSLRSQFNQAFRGALAAGEKEFEWNGKKYTTELYKPTTGPSFRGTGRPTPQYAPKQENKMPNVNPMGDVTGMRKGGAAHKARGGSLSKDEAMAKKLEISTRMNRNRPMGEFVHSIPEYEQRWTQAKKRGLKEARAKTFPKGMYHPSEYDEEGHNLADERGIQKMLQNKAEGRQMAIATDPNRKYGPNFKGWAKDTKEKLGYNAKGGRIQRATGGRTRRKSSKTDINIYLPQQDKQQGAQGGMQPAIPPELIAAMMGGGGAPGMPPAGPAPAIPPMAPSPGMPGMAPAGAGPGLGAMGAMGGGGPGMTPPMPPMRKAGGRVAKQGGGALGSPGFSGGQQDMGGRPKGRSQFHRGPAGVGDAPSQGEPGMAYPGGSPNFDESTGMYRPGFGPGMARPLPMDGSGKTPMPMPMPMPMNPGMGGQMPIQMGPGFPGGAPLSPMPMNPGNGMGGMRPPSFGQMPIGGGSPPISQANAMANMGIPQMARKNGGRTMPKYRMKDVGSGSGLGRLEKRDFPPADGTAPVGRAYGGRAGKTGPLSSDAAEDMIFGTTKFAGKPEETAQAEGQYAYKKNDTKNPYPKSHPYHSHWNEGYKKMSKDKDWNARQEEGRVAAIKHNEDIARRRAETEKKSPQLLDMFDRTYRPINIDKAYPKRGKKE